MLNFIFTHTNILLHNIKLIVVLFIILFAFLNYKSKAVNINDIKLKIAINAFLDKKFDLATHYYFELIKTNTTNDIHILYKYARSLLLSSEKNINLIIEAYKELANHINSSEIMSLEFINQLRNLGMIDTLEKISSKTDNPLHLAAIYSDVDIAKAIKYLNLIPLENRHSTYYVLSADLHFELGLYLETINDTDNLILLGYHNLDPYYQRLQALLRSNEIEKAKETLKLYENIQVLYESKNINLKLNATENIINMYSSFLNNMDFKVVYLTLLLQNNEQERFIDILNTIDIKTLSSENREKLLQVTLKLGAHEAFNLIYDKISQPTLTIVNLSSDESIIYCRFFIQTSNQKKAQEICKFGLDQYPHIAPLSYWNAQLFLRNQNIDEAIELLHQSIKLAPWMNIWRIQLAQIYLTQGKSKKALLVVQEDVVYQSHELDNFIRKNGLKINNEN